jgi:uncharacterized protein (TIGR02147 family)
MAQVSVFQFQNPRAFLLAVLREREGQETGFSIRAWAKEMGLRSHSLLVLLLQGKRPIRLRHIEFLAPVLRLSSAERLYFQAMIQLANAKSEEERRLCEIWLADLHPGGNFRVQELDQYAVIAHWIHTAILTLVRVPSFRGTPEEVVARFGSRVTLTEARTAILRLEELGLLKRGPEGRLVATNTMVSTRDDSSMKAVREHHKQVTELARLAVDHQDVTEREFQAFSVAVRPDQISLVKEMIRRFRMQVAQALHSNHDSDLPPTDIYQVNLQFFRLTESPHVSIPVRSEDEGAAIRNPSLERTLP